MNHKEKNLKLESKWRSHIKEFQSSNLNRKQYCQKNNLIPHQLGYWIRRVEILDKRKSSDFTEVKIETPKTPNSTIKIKVELANDISISAELNDSCDLFDIIKKLAG